MIDRKNVPQWKLKNVVCNPNVVVAILYTITTTFHFDFWHGRCTHFQKFQQFQNILINVQST
jgi:hypothetical protein